MQFAWSCASAASAFAEAALFNCGMMKEIVTFWFGVFYSAFNRWLDSNAFVFAGALAFFTLFSIAPIVIIAVTIVGFVFGEEAASGQIAERLQTVIGHEAADAVQTTVANIHIDQSGLMPAMIGIVVMVFGATTVFAQMQLSLNTIWGVVPKPSRNSIFIFIKNRLLSLTIVVVIGFVLLVSLVLSVAVQAAMKFAATWWPVPPFAVTATGLLLSLTVVTLLFATIFRVLPDVVLRWRDVLPGALLTTVLFTIGRWLIAFYLARTATASTYGAAGSLVMLLVWVNYSSLILLFGAAFTRAHLEARGLQIRPRNSAVNVHYHIEEEAPASMGKRSAADV